MAATGCGSKPSVNVPASLTTIGHATPLTVTVHDDHGVKKASATIEQNGAQYAVWQTGESKGPDATFHFTVGAKTTPQLQDGKAKLMVEVTGGGLMGGDASVERDVNGGDAAAER